MNQDGDLINGQPSDAFTGTVTLNDQKGPFIVLASPLGAVSQAVSAITLQFSEQIDPATFSTADVAIAGPAGPISVTSVLPASPTTFIITIPAQQVEGDYPFTIGPSIADLQGNNLAAAYSGLFSIDRTGPRIIEMTPQGTVGQVVSSVLLRFDSAILASSFTAADIALDGPGGVIPPSITRIGEAEYRIDFPAQRIGRAHV